MAVGSNFMKIQSLYVDLRHQILWPCIVLCLLGCSCFLGCSNRGIGGVTGALVGTGIGGLTGYAQGDLERGALIGGVAGAVLGTIAGGMFPESESEEAQTEKIVIRTPRYPLDTQKEIDTIRQQMEDSSILGGGEVKPWNERYQGNEVPIHYQGPETGLSF